MACQFFAMFPFGWITLNCYTAASLNVPQRDLGVAIGLIGAFRSVGGSIGSVIFSSIFNQVSEKEVASRIIRTATNAGVSSENIAGLLETVHLSIVGVPGLQAKFPDVPAQVYDACITAARYGYAYGLRVTWLASIPFGIIATLCAMAVIDPSKYFTNHVEVHLEEKFSKGGKANVERGEVKKVEEA